MSVFLDALSLYIYLSIYLSISLSLFSRHRELFSFPLTSGQSRCRPLPQHGEPCSPTPAQPRLSAEPCPGQNAHATVPCSQPSSNDARYAFVVEWYDPTASLIRQYQLIFYASDSTLEMVRTALISDPGSS
jgi:hypothetical protein